MQIASLIPLCAQSWSLTFHKCTKLLPDDILELLDFVLSTTYFSYDGRIYRQIQGALMGSPVSVVVSKLYMEDHEEKSIGSAPNEMKQKMWKRYVDDSFKIIKQDQRPLHCPLEQHRSDGQHTFHR